MTFEFCVALPSLSRRRWTHIETFRRRLLHRLYSRRGQFVAGNGILERLGEVLVEAA